MSAKKTTSKPTPLPSLVKAHKPTVDENAHTIAQSLNLGVRRIYQLVKEGVLPGIGRGECDIVRYLEAYVRYLQSAMSAKASIDSDGAVLSGKDQRTKLLAVQTEREELELAREKSQVIAVADYSVTIAHMIIETKARLKAVAPRVAVQLVGESSRVMIQAKIDKGIDEALADLSKSVPRFLRATVVLPGPDDDACTPLES
jgi:hypothetical protein